MKEGARGQHPEEGSAEEILTLLEAEGVRLGLDATRRLLGGFGSPEQGFPVVLVAGTNGKGSCSAVLAAMATAAGYRTGLYTSPHLEDVRERVRVDGVAVSEPEFTALLREVVATARVELGSPPTYFEALTVCALLCFAAHKVDLAVLEVGLGGRLDATNVTEPVLSVITDIAVDHRDLLGPTTADIAREKAGILRPDRPAVGWVEDLQAAAALEEVARRLGASLRLIQREVEIDRLESDAWRGQSLEITIRGRKRRLECPLCGAHQARNLTLAVAAAEVLSDELLPAVDDEAVAAGARGVRWPGRLELVPVPQRAPALLDGAHNPSGAMALRSFLEEAAVEYDLLFGALADKEVERMLPPLGRDAQRIFLTVPTGGRARDPYDLARLVPSERVRVLATPAEALDQVAERPRLLVVTGSLYLVGEVRGLLRERYGVPEPAVDSPTVVLG